MGCSMVFDSGDLKTWLFGYLVGGGLGDAFQVGGLALLLGELARVAG